MSSGVRSHEKLMTAAKSVLVAPAGAFIGSVVANQVFPPTIEYAPGIKAEVAASSKPGVTVDAVLTTIHAPNAPVDSPIPGINGVHARIVEFKPSGNGDALKEQYVSLISKAHASVVQPTVDVLQSNLEKGALGGALTASAISYFSMRYLQHRKAKKLEVSQDIQALEEAGTPKSLAWAKQKRETKHASEKSTNRRLRVAASLAAMGMALGMGNDQKPESVAAPPDMTELNSPYMDGIPELRGIKIEGLAGKLIPAGLVGIGQAQKDIDNFWDQATTNFRTAYANYETGQTTSAAAVSFVHISDLHCNRAYMDHTLKPMLKRLRLPVIVNTGDTFTNSMTMPYEKSCMQDFVNVANEAAKANDMNVKIINVAGNHDPKTKLHIKESNAELVTLDKDATEAEGIIFMGIEDPLSTTWSDSPDNEADLDKKEEAYGKELAKKACDYMSDNPDKPLVLLAHHKEVSQQAVDEGCATLTLNGHTHHNSPIESTIGQNGRIVLQHTAGSAGGADIGFTLYEKPKQDASITINTYDKDAGRFTGFVTATTHTDGRVDISPETIPDPVPFPAR